MANQFFAETQFEAYRALGYPIANGLFCENPALHSTMSGPAFEHRYKPDADAVERVDDAPNPGDADA